MQVANCLCWFGNLLMKQYSISSTDFQTSTQLDNAYIYDSQSSSIITVSVFEILGRHLRYPLGFVVASCQLAALLLPECLLPWVPGEVRFC